MAVAATRLLSVAACDSEPEFRNSDGVFQQEVAPEAQQDLPVVADRFVLLEDELLAEQFDPDALYENVPDSIAGDVVESAKQLTNHYANVKNPKSRAAQVQRLVRDSLTADAFVVATVVGKTQENRNGYEDNLLPWTVYDFKVVDVLEGDEPVDTFRLEKLGGTIDGTVTLSCS